MSDYPINKSHVRAVVFAVGTKGKRYYTSCRGSKIGDLVEAPGWSGPATVVAYGHPADEDAPRSFARIIKRAAISHTTLSDWERAEESRLIINQENTNMRNENPATPLEVAENRQAEATAEIKRLKKQAKRAKKLADEAEAIVMQCRQRRELALTVLEDIVASTTASDSSRIEAATKLFELA